MSLFETRSQRLKRQASSGQASVYQYDDLSSTFRNQVIHIWLQSTGDQRLSHDFWVDIYQTLCEAKGVFRLIDKIEIDFLDDVAYYFFNTGTEEVLDIIELTFSRLYAWQKSIGLNPPTSESSANKMGNFPSNPSISEPSVNRMEIFSSDPSNLTLKLQYAHEAIDKLNARFQQHNIGYTFIEGQLVRKDSEYIHSELTVPAIVLLNELNFKGASDEFLKAQEHYKNGRYKESSVDALKAFESTMKSICDSRKWSYDSSRATANALIEIMFQKQLIPSYLDNQFSSLKKVLESGTPTVRNKTSGHGQGTNVTEVPQYMAAYALHMAAANIVFLVNAHKKKK